MSGKFHEMFGIEAEDDGSYRAWRTCQQGGVSHFKIVPAAKSGAPVRLVPYLQPITIELHAESNQLALLCHSTGMVIFIEGTGLEGLADQISERRVRSIHAYDYDKPANWQESEPYISNITVEQSS